MYEIEDLAEMFCIREIPMETAVDFSIMVEKPENRQALMEWMEENPQATEQEIFKKIKEIVLKKM